MASQSETLVHRWVDEVLNRGNFAVVDELYAPGFVNLSQPSQAPGPEGVKQGVAQLRNALSDLRVSIDDIVACGDRVVWMYTARGTHSGEFRGVAPTNQAVEYQGIVMARVVDDRFAEGRGIMDQLAFVQQIGLLSAAPVVPQ